MRSPVKEYETDPKFIEALELAKILVEEKQFDLGAAKRIASKKIGYKPMSHIGDRLEQIYNNKEVQKLYVDDLNDESQKYFEECSDE